ncbi:hypothetical protein K492DRAFT_200550 [Lichtheimia hyalospora FSU 10163]|nr:hypothetical protein K492DRAFT_200550 [Lichtheimia hyalospora FSU 10163]
MVSHEAYLASLPYDYTELYEPFGKLLLCSLLILFIYIGDRGRSLVFRFLVSLVVLVFLRLVLVIWWWFSSTGIPQGNGFHDWCKTHATRYASKSSGSHSAPVSLSGVIAFLHGVTLSFPGVVLSRLVLVIWWWFSPSGIPQGNGFNDWCKTQMKNSCASMSDSDDVSAVGDIPVVARLPGVPVSLPGVVVSSPVVPVVPAVLPSLPSLPSVPVVPVVPVPVAFVPSLLPSLPQEQDVPFSSAPVPSLLPSEPQVPVVLSALPSEPQVPVVPFSSASVPVAVLSTVLNASQNVDVDDLCAEFEKLDVYDLWDEDTYMRPPVDIRYEEPLWLTLKFSVEPVHTVEDMDTTEDMEVVIPSPFLSPAATPSTTSEPIIMDVDMPSPTTSPTPAIINTATTTTTTITATPAATPTTANTTTTIMTSPTRPHMPPPSLPSQQSTATPLSSSPTTTTTATATATHLPTPSATSLMPPPPPRPRKLTTFVSTPRQEKIKGL